MKLFILTLAILVGLLVEPSLAATKKFRIKPDGDIRFDVPLDGPTRLSVADDRIAKIIQSNSSFDMANDENTGDVFLRYVGSASDPEKETGYLITEAGHTIGFTIQPRASLDKQTVLITLISVKPKTDVDVSSSLSGAEKPDGFLVSDGAVSGRTGALVAFAQEAFAARIDTKKAGAKSSSARKTYSKGSFTAQIFRAKAAPGSIPSPQNFYQNKRTLAVFVDDDVSAGFVWVIVIGARS